MMWKKSMEEITQLKIIKVISLIVMVIMLVLIEKYQNASDMLVIPMLAIFWMSMVLFFASIILIGFEKDEDTRKHIVSKNILKHFDVWDDLDD